MSEIALGHLANDKATNADVKAFGNRMITDHGRAAEELKQLALTKGVALPAVVGKEQSKTANDLSKKVGKDFDRWDLRIAVWDCSLRKNSPHSIHSPSSCRGCSYGMKVKS